MASVFARPGAPVRPLRAWSNAALAGIALRVDDIVRAWAAEWGLGSPSLPPVHCEAGDRDLETAGRWMSFRHQLGDAAWLQWGEASGAALAEALFGVRECSTPVVAAVLAACRDDAVRRLAAVLEVAPRSTGEGCSTPAKPGRWSGTVWVALPWGGRLVMQAGVVQPLLTTTDPLPVHPPAPGLVRVTDALAQHATRLQAHLESCEIVLAELRDLRPGDVLRLTHRVNAPINVADTTGASLFEGWLARRGGRKAVELVAHAPR